MLRESKGAVMNLENLNQIAKEEKDLLEKARRLDEQSGYLARKRNDMEVLSGFIRSMELPSPRYPKFHDTANTEVLRIINSISQDVFRAAEMKFAAEARELRIEAKLKNQQIKNFLPDSEVL